MPDVALCSSCTACTIVCARDGNASGGTWLAIVALHMSNFIFCLVPGPSRIRRIADDWLAAGFSHAELSIVLPDRPAVRDLVLDWREDLRAVPLPGMGPFLVSGPLRALLKDALEHRTGGSGHAFTSLGLSEFDADQLEGRLRAGSSLVAVEFEDDIEMTSAQEICERHRAEHVHFGHGSRAEPAQ